MAARPTYVSPPGETIQEEMKAKRISGRMLAKRLGMKPSKLRAIMTGRERITKHIAEKLSKVFAYIAEDFWLIRDEKYHLELEGKYNPMKEIRKLANERKTEEGSERYYS